MTKTVDRASASPGDVLTYTLTVTSQISIPSHPTGTVTDVLPAGLTFVSASTGCTNAGQTVTCTFIPPAAGDSLSFTVLAPHQPRRRARTALQHVDDVASERHDSR